MKISLHEPAHVIAFTVSLGIAAFLASALWGAFFIVALPMDDDAITNVIEIERGENRYGVVQTERRPIEFKNPIEQSKYYHNVRMRDRNSYWVYGQMIVGGLFGLFVFYILPKWRNTLESHHDTTETVCTGAILGVMAVLIVPIVLSWILPAPVKWFPQVITDIARTREKEALTHLGIGGFSVDTPMVAERRKQDQAVKAKVVAEMRKRAEKGDVHQQFVLGSIYHNGELVPKDSAEAVKWYRLAAEQGHFVAQCNLGVMYANGEGVPKDLVQAQVWYNIAGRISEEFAKKYKAEVFEKMTSEQKAEAMKLASELFAKLPKGK